MEDSEIVELYWQRSDTAIRETSRKYGGYCQRIAYNISRSREDAEECVNDTWLRAWNAMPTERPAILSAFLGCITRSLALDQWRAKHRKKRGGGELPLALDELDHCIPAPGSPQQRLEQKELEAAIARFVSALPETEKQVFVARYWAFVPVAEIAKKLSCSPGKIKSMLFRLRKRLKEHLQEVELW